MWVNVHFPLVKNLNPKGVLLIIIIETKHKPLVLFIHERIQLYNLAPARILIELNPERLCEQKASSL